MKGLSFDYNEQFMWLAASRHDVVNNFPNDQLPTAILLVQECNMGGAYIREILYDAEGKTYQTQYRVKNGIPGDNWGFTLTLAEMRGKDTVDRKSGLTYNVISHKNDEFIKLLQR